MYDGLERFGSDLREVRLGVEFLVQLADQRTGVSETQDTRFSGKCKLGLRSHVKAGLTCYLL
jgi:hypothetical protein